MAIQYSGGTIINRTTGSIVTRVDWCNFVSQALLDAGWTTISGTPGAVGAGGSVVQESAAGNQGQKIRVVLSDPGSGTCAQAFIRNSAGTITSQAFFANPPFTWRVVANKFHFFAFVSGSAFRLSSRSFIAGGVLYVPTFIPLSAGDPAGFMEGMATSDIDTVGHCSWRNSLRQYDSANACGRFSGIYISTIFEASGLSTHSGNRSILWWQGGFNTAAYRWEDTTLTIIEPLISWATGTSNANESRIKGQFYDAIIVSGQVNSETVITLDGHSWLAVTDQATGTLNCDQTLYLAVS